MTVTVHVDVRKLSGTGADTGVSDARLEVSPYQARHVDGVPDYVLSTNILSVPLVNGVGSFILPGPTPAGTALRVQERGFRGARERIVSVADVAVVNYGDLPDVDPTTLIPSLPLTLAWQTYIAGLADGLAAKQPIATLDADVAAKVPNDATATGAALSARYAPGRTAVIPTDGSDAGPALNTILAAAASSGVRVYLPPKANITIATAVTIPSGTRLDLNGSTLLSSPATSVNFRLLVLDTVTNVEIRNGVIDGQKASFASATEQRHNIYMVGSSFVVLRDVTSQNAKGDGIYVGSDLAGASTDVTFYNVHGIGNHRNGLSITSAQRFRQFGGHYRFNTGISPMSGLDIEPNTDTALLDDLEFTGVDFSFNGYDGVIAQAKSATPSARQAGFQFIGCTSTNNGAQSVSGDTFGNGLHIRWAKDVSWVGGSIRSNTQRGVRIRDTLINIKIDSSIESNGHSGIAQDGGANDNITDLVIRGYIWGNGTSAAAGTYDGVDLSGTGVRLKFEATSGGSQHRYGLRTVPSWSQVSVSSSARFPGNTTGAVNMTDDFGTRVSLSPDVPLRVGRSLATDVALGTRITSDSVDRFSYRADGRLQWSVGTSAIDVTFERTAAGVVGVGALHALRGGRGTTANRPSAVTVGSGGTWFDTTLVKPIWSDGTVWRDSTGTAV